MRFKRVECVEQSKRGWREKQFSRDRLVVAKKTNFQSSKQNNKGVENKQQTQ